jgi:hypothetical protein
MNRGPLRRIVGLIAAYAVALNMLLPAFNSIAASPSGDFAVICASAGGGASSPLHAPDKPLPCPACATCTMAGCAGGAVDTRVESQFSPVATEIPSVSPRRETADWRLTLGGIRLARAPPRA